jgi:DNA-nicking Smr family endonuclease
MTSKDDDIVFAEAMRDVKPLKDIERAATRTVRPAPRAHRSRAARLAMLRETLDGAGGPTEQLGEELAFRRPQVSESVFRQLRRGRFAVEAEIDLHGMTGPQAKAALKDFVAESMNRGLRCVRVIHGKGLRSGTHGPVLKGLVSNWLAQWDAVLAFVSARLNHGGGGAVYVLLRRG